MTLLDTLASIGVGILALMVIVNVWIPNTIYRYKHGKRDESWSNVGAEQYAPSWGPWLYAILVVYMLLVGLLIPFIA